MGYYSNRYRSDNTGCLATIVSIILCVALLCGLMFGANACSASDWNDGVCPHCHIRYELRGVSKGLKYYACPKCGQEVERF